MEKNQEMLNKGDGGSSSPKNNDSALKVFVRVRPFLKREAEHENCTPIVEIDDPETSKIITTVNVNQSTDTTKRESYTFERCFNGVKLDTMAFETDDIFADVENNVFPNRTDQSLVYAYVGLPVLRNVLDGYNGCILAYGQTGSGKTFTMMGPPSVCTGPGGKSSNQGQNEANSEAILGVEGIIPRLVRDLFEQLHQKHMQDDSHSFKLELEYYEIYNEKVLDLLSSTSDDPLRIRQHTERGVYVEGLTRKRITSEKDLFKWLKRGNMERHTGCTKMNDRSSRSHAILALHLTQVQLSQVSSDTFGMGTSVITSKLNLVDLAGSERAAASGAVGLQLQEANKINQSLTALGRVIDALADISQGKTEVFCPYRDSTLTLLLRDSLGGNSKTTMVATVSPHCLNFDETTQTLRYASRAKQIVSKVSINEDPNITCIRLLTEKVKRLQACLGDGNRGDQYIEELMGRIDVLESQLVEKELIISQLSAELTSSIRESSLPSSFFSSQPKVPEEARNTKKTPSSRREDSLRTVSSPKSTEGRTIKVASVDHQALLLSLRYELRESKKNEKELLAELEEYRKRKNAQIQKAVAEAKEEWLDERASLFKELRQIRSAHEEMEKKMRRLEENYKSAVHENATTKIMDVLSGIKVDMSHSNRVAALSKKAVDTLRTGGFLSPKKTVLDDADLIMAVNALTVGLEAAKEANANLLNYYSSVIRERLENSEHQEWSELYASSQTITTVRKTTRRKSSSAHKSFSRGERDRKGRDGEYHIPPPPLAFTRGESRKTRTRPNASTPRGSQSSGRSAPQSASPKTKSDISSNASFPQDGSEVPSPRSVSNGQTVYRISTATSGTSKDSLKTSSKSSPLGDSSPMSPLAERHADVAPNGSLNRSNRRGQPKELESQGKDGKEIGKSPKVVGKVRKGRGEKDRAGTGEKSGSRRRVGSASSVHSSPLSHSKPQLSFSSKDKGKELKKSKTSTLRTNGVAEELRGLPKSSVPSSLNGRGIPPIPLVPSTQLEERYQANASGEPLTEAEKIYRLASENEQLKLTLKNLSDKANRSEFKIGILNQLLQTRDRIYEGVKEIGVNPACIGDTLVNIERAARKEWEKEEALHRRNIVQQMNLSRNYIHSVASLTTEKEKLSKSLIQVTEKRDQYAREVKNALEDHAKLMQANEAVVTKNKFLKQQIQNDKAQWETKEKELETKVASLEREVKYAQDRLLKVTASDDEKVTSLTAELKRVQEEYRNKQTQLQSHLDELKKECTNWAVRLANNEEENESHRLEVNMLQEALQHSKVEVAEVRQQLTLLENTSKEEKDLLETELKTHQAASSTSKEKWENELEEAINEKANLLQDRAVLQHQVERLEKELQEKEQRMREEQKELASLYDEKIEKLLKKLEEVEFARLQHQSELERQWKEDVGIHEKKLRSLQEEMQKEIHDVTSDLETERKRKEEAEENVARLKEEFQRTADKCTREETSVDDLTTQVNALQDECNSRRAKATDQENEVARLNQECSLLSKKMENQNLALHQLENETEKLAAQVKQYEKRIAELYENQEVLHNEHERKLKEAKVVYETSKSEWLFEKERFQAAIEGLTSKIHKNQEEMARALKEKDDELVLLKEAQEKVLAQCIALEGEKLSAEEVLRQKVELLDAHKKVLDQRNSQLQSTIAELQEELREKEEEIQELKDLNFMQHHLDRVEEQSNFSGMDSASNSRISSLTKLSALIQKKLFRYRNNDNKSNGEPDSSLANSSFFGEGFSSSDPHSPSFSSINEPIPSIHEMLSAKVDCSAALRRQMRPSVYLNPGRDLLSPSKTEPGTSGATLLSTKTPMDSRSRTFVKKMDKAKPRLSPPPADPKEVLRFAN